MNLVGRILKRLIPRSLLESPKAASSRIMKVPVDNQELSFQVFSKLEAGRVHSFFFKEPGTLKWLQDEVKPGQHFCDIGANIGIYSMYGALRVGPGGHVYAFEPHLPNCSSLLANVAINSFVERFDVFSCALHDRAGFFDFECSSLTAGSSFNQISAGLKSSESPAAEGLKSQEKKYSTSLDLLLESGVILPPHHVKIDVDGNELSILRGMSNFLLSDQRPISLQVEVDPAFATEIKSYLASVGFSETSRHFTYAGQQSVDRGTDPNTIACNVIYKASL